MGNTADLGDIFKFWFTPISMRPEAMNWFAHSINGWIAKKTTSWNDLVSYPPKKQNLPVPFLRWIKYWGVHKDTREDDNVMMMHLRSPWIGSVRSVSLQHCQWIGSLRLLIFQLASSWAAISDPTSVLFAAAAAVCPECESAAMWELKPAFKSWVASAKE